MEENGQGFTSERTSERPAPNLVFGVAVLLVIGGVEVNPGPQVEQGKIDQILSYVKNQEKES
jgi:hypothetical protein